ncbi:MAG TPA: hypothetical protein VMT30_08340 [Candidatus Saccharimonadia bacterium]|nr:hypothetical protein [Candidatus Saccharimonadia bacterium]
MSAIQAGRRTPWRLIALAAAGAALLAVATHGTPASAPHTGSAAKPNSVATPEITGHRPPPAPQAATTTPPRRPDQRLFSVSVWWINAHDAGVQSQISVGGNAYNAPITPHPGPHGIAYFTVAAAFEETIDVITSRTSRYGIVGTLNCSITDQRGEIIDLQWVDDGRQGLARCQKLVGWGPNPNRRIKG